MNMKRIRTATIKPNLYKPCKLFLRLDGIIDPTTIEQRKVELLGPTLVHTPFARSMAYNRDLGAIIRAPYKLISVNAFNQYSLASVLFGMKA